MQMREKTTKAVTGRKRVNVLYVQVMIGCVPEAFYTVRTLEGVWGYSSLYGARGEALWQKVVLGHFKGQK